VTSGKFRFPPQQYYFPSDKGNDSGGIMEQYEFTIVRYDHRGLMADTVVAAGRHEIQDLLDDGWNVFLVKPVELEEEAC
jgi:hypothetical protein